MEAGLCKRCLLEQANERELFKSVSELIEALSEDKKTPPDAYASRLAACLDCPYLLSGTCVKCGCFVELRAARLRMSCPNDIPQW